ncbi:DUF72 domain-containing protein [Cobetia crustatorum]|uniref:DUF72 domain-containing protein n=2 Tax=Cobetia TaxID=204286 RepID=A0A558HS47_9GAMM|nr:DUF72 domain-containing protein [Cobetia crustatorum]
MHHKRAVISPNAPTVDTEFGELHLGLAMWANDDWRGSLLPGSGPREHLADYAQVFDCVEGNTSFYAQPTAEAIASWARQAPAGFRFCFKLPGRLTHELRMVGIEDELAAFLERIAPLKGRLGPIMVQLPRDLGGEVLPRLEQFFVHVQAEGFEWAVEPRDPIFFAKGEVERQLNRLLISHGVDRVMLDVRPLFSGPNTIHPGLAVARSEKPHRPLHVFSSARQPIVRFIGHYDEATNLRLFVPWIERLFLWIKQGKSPFLFVHTPDNKAAPALARLLANQVHSRLGWRPIGEFPGECQGSLF